VGVVAGDVAHLREELLAVEPHLALLQLLHQLLEQVALVVRDLATDRLDQVRERHRPGHDPLPF
jgi:hypothetical protein